jgi:hypothetical protein
VFIIAATFVLISPFSTPNFLGVIPGGQSFAIPQSQLSDVAEQGTGFSWTPNLRGGTTLILVGGDSRGNGTAGSVLNTVSSGINNIGSCLNDASPSSTPGSPAGGSYPTSSTGGVGGSGGGGGGGSGSGTNIGAIVGGVVGGVAGLAIIVLLIFFWRRRETAHARHEKRALDLLNADDEEDAQAGPIVAPGLRPDGRPHSRNELPEFYQPSPYTLPDPTVSSAYETNSEGRPLSGYSETDRHTTTTEFLGSLYAGAPGGPGSVAGSSTGRKGPMRQMRPVNIIQHDDAGPSEPAAAEEVETVELPPAYTNIRTWKEK